MTTAVTTKLERRIRRLLDPAANRRPLTAGRTVLGVFLALTLLVPIAGVRAEQTLKAPTVISLPQVTREPKLAAEPVVMTAPKKTLRVVTQIAQATPPAQSSPTGALSGVVSDPSGAVIAGAKVLIQPNPMRGVLYSGGAVVPLNLGTVTNAVGQWSFYNFPAGTYTLEIGVPGFKTFNKTVTVSPGIDSQVDAHLQIGRSTETVTVTAQRPSDVAFALTPAPAVQASSKPIRVSGGVQPAKLIRHVTPVFPQSARDRGIQGSVTFEAIIDKAGFLRETPLAISAAPPDLVQAALDAIRQWQYTPALLNGEPVEILTEITVNFTLQ